VGGRTQRAGIEIQTVAPRGCRGAVVVRLTGVVDSATVARLRDALSCLASRPVVIDVEGCTLATREFGQLLAEQRDRGEQCFVACPRIGARLLLGLRGDEPLHRVHESVLDALAAMAVAERGEPGAYQPYGELSLPAACEPAYT
jgi:hypothetical protein